VVFLLEKTNHNGCKKKLIWKRTAVTGAIVAAMAAPLIVMPHQAHADLASAVESGSYGPVVTIVTPQYADVVKGASVSISISVQQRSNPVKALEMFVDDNLATPGWVPLKSLQSSSFNWDTSLFSNGPHKLTVRVVDSQGLIGQAEITVYVNNGNQQQDATAPALKWLGVQNGQTLNGIVNLQLQASDSFGVKYIFVMLNSASDPDKKPALRSWMINQPPYIIPFDTTKVNDGSYVLDALAYDALSNQGEAPRLSISIANNSINPTVFQADASSSPKSTSTDTTNTANTTSPAPDTSNTSHTSNTNVAPVNTQNNVSSGMSFSSVAPTLVPGQPRQGALNDDNSANDNDDGSSLTVEVTSSAELHPAPEAQPRVTPLPMRLASNDVKTPSAAAPVSTQNDPPKTTIAQPNLFASSDETALTSTATDDGQPLTTLAESKVSSLPAIANSGNPETTKSASSVREAALPPQTAPTKKTAVENNMRQAQPLSTIINTLSPGSVLTPSGFTQTARERSFPVQDAMSMPVNKVHVAASAKFDLPVFPQASLNTHAPKAAPVKSTFTAPSVDIADANLTSRIAPAVQSDHTAPTLMANARTAMTSHYVAVTNSSRPLSTASLGSLANSRMTPAIQGKYNSSRLMADAQLGTLPGYVAPKPVSTSTLRPTVSGRPLFTAPDVSLTSSRIASANVSGKAWGYQRPANSELGQSTKPQVAFLPKFNTKSTSNALVSITVSPVSSKMQVAETTHSWPAVYQARQAEKLSAIAQRYGLPVEVLARNNNLKNAAVLTAGQKIKMPRNLQVTYNGKPMQSDVSSMLVGTTSVAAFRFLFEQQGGKVTWDAATQTVHAKNGNNEITLTIGSNQAVVNQKNVMMDMAAFLLSGRTMVPVRLFEKSLNVQVTWDPSTGRMFMAMAG
jgi:LysM repeat protein